MMHRNWTWHLFSIFAFLGRPCHHPPWAGGQHTWSNWDTLSDGDAYIKQQHWKPSNYPETITYISSAVVQRGSQLFWTPKKQKYIFKVTFLECKNDLVLLFQNLSNNQLQRKGAKIVSTMLADNYKIKSIKLSGDHLHLSPLNIFVLLFFWISNLINFPCLPIGNEFGDSAIKYIAEVLKVST